MGAGWSQLHEATQSHFDAEVLRKLSCVQPGPRVMKGEI